MIILGISGKRGVGKNYISDHYLIPEIIQHFSKKDCVLVPYYFSFGSPVKIELYARDQSDQLTYHNLFIQKTNETRKLLQTYATENGRDKHNKDMWIRAVDMWIHIHLEELTKVNRYVEKKLIPFFIIQDVRFQNEYDYIKNMGGLLVLVEAPQRNLQRIKEEKDNENKIHESELGLEHLDFDLRIKNDLNDLFDIEHTIQNFISNLGF